MAKEQRLIDIEPVKKFIVDGLNNKEPNKAFGHDAIEILAEIEYAPTVDAVEVVRCRECRWSRGKDHREPTETPKRLICQCFMNHHIPAPWEARLAVDPEHFCSYGERRSDNAAD